MKKTLQLLLILSIVVGWYSFGTACPSLKLGLPNGSGGYEDYVANLINPELTNTAIPTGFPSSLLVGGVYFKNSLHLGGKYGTGADWSNFGFNSIFDGKGAVLMATVPAENRGNITIGSSSPFYKTNLANNKFLFFDIGNFSNYKELRSDYYTDIVPVNGEAKDLTVKTSGFDWIHYDVFAIHTLTHRGGIMSYLTGNPGSQDVTQILNSAPPIPEPGTVFLLGAGLLGIGLYGRKRFKK